MKMEKENLPKIMTSIVLGIMTVLLLTLNLWGKEWYKLLASLLTGIVVGVAIYDYRLVLKAINIAFEKTGDKIKNIQPIRMPVISRPKINFKKIGSIILVLLIITINYGLYFYLFYSCTKFSVSMTVAAIMILIVLMALVAVIGLSDDNKSRLISAVYKKLRFWAEENGDDYLAARNILIWGACWHVNLISLAYLLIRFVMEIILVIIQAIFSVPLVIVWLFKIIGQNKATILITVSIVAGGLIGTFTGSYITGLASGLSIMALALITKKVSNLKVNVAYFFKTLNWADKFTEFS